MPDQLTPHRAVRTTVSSPAGELAALIAEPERPGAPTLLLVPGYTGSKEDFAPILDPLMENGFRAVAIEMPGQHESSGPDDETAYSPSALGPVMAEVVRTLAAGDRRVVLLGHSYGGLVCRQAVLAGAPIAGLILLCSGPAAFTSGNRFEAITAGEPILRNHGPAFLFDSRAQALGLDPHGPEPIAAFMRGRFLASTPAGLLGMGNALLTEPDLVGQLAAALADRRLPVAVMAGEHDDAWPLTDQAEMAARLGTALTLIPGGGHSPAVEAPAALLDELLPLLRTWTARA